jgi:polar amino acid transport system substrate-binding protein
VAIDPVRAADMDYTAPYVIIEGAYLVRNGSPLQRNEEVDRAGTASWSAAAAPTTCT